MQQLSNCPRIDIVCDTYRDDSLKETTYVKRGKSMRKMVSPKTEISPNFSPFLHDNMNKEELFACLTNDVSVNDYPPEKEVYMTLNTSVTSNFHNKPRPESDQEEADTRMYLHASDAFKRSARYVLCENSGYWHKSHSGWCILRTSEPES